MRTKRAKGGSERIIERRKIKYHIFSLICGICVCAFVTEKQNGDCLKKGNSPALMGVGSGWRE